MSGNKTPMGVDLEMPDPPPPRIYALYDNDKPCVEHHVAYRGSLPGTGPIHCFICGGRWDEKGKYLGVYFEHS